MKYRPDYPQRFDSLEHALAWARSFFQWYNFEHLHSGTGYVTPAALHFGLAHSIFEQRQLVLDEAYSKYPHRFVHGLPSAPPIPTEVWINKPFTASEAFETSNGVINVSI